MDELGRFIVELPPPLGIIVSALFPPVAIASGVGAVLAYRRRRRGLVVLMVVLFVFALVGAIAFLGVAGRP
jgi:hypothetical protein